MHRIWKKAKRILGNQRGDVFLGNGLWIILVVFALAVAAAALAGGISGKFTALTTTLQNISIPSI